MSDFKNSPFIIGIDLGTTNSAVSYIDTTAGDALSSRIQTFKIPQALQRGVVGESSRLPSFIYLPGLHELPADVGAMPWEARPVAKAWARPPASVGAQTAASARARSSASMGDSSSGVGGGDERRIIVGEFARIQGALVPSRLVSSAKSWLCHNRVDRKAAILPWDAAPGVEKISPVEASALFLKHIVEAWNFKIAVGNDAYRMERQQVVIGIPASFDESARELTAEAARAAGLQRFSMLEEPQAACYAWINANAGLLSDGREPEINSREKGQIQDLPLQNEDKNVGTGLVSALFSGEDEKLLLVFDVGGGTTDFNLIGIKNSGGVLKFDRKAVGDHLMLGGDNMDLTLARSMETKLTGGTKKLDLNSWLSLAHQCRAAKEAMLTTPDDAQYNVIDNAVSDALINSSGTSFTSAPAAAFDNPHGAALDNASGAALDKAPDANPNASAMEIVLLGTGRGVVGGSSGVEITRRQCEEIILDGFFEAVAPGDEILKDIRSGFQGLGLPYVADPSVMRHLSAFLRNHASNPNLHTVVDKTSGLKIVRPDLLLFNGGVFTPSVIRNRVYKILSGWFSDSRFSDDKASNALPSGDKLSNALPSGVRHTIRVFENDMPEQAVAAGAAYYGLVLRSAGRTRQSDRTQTIRITGGAAKAYYIETARAQAINPGPGPHPAKRRFAPAADTLACVCIAPRGLQEGLKLHLAGPKFPEFHVAANSPVSFALYSSSYRTGDSPGDVISAPRDSFVELPPIKTILHYGKKGDALKIPVNLGIRLNEFGTLDVWCESKITTHKWRLAFQVRKTIDDATRPDMDTEVNPDLHSDENGRTNPSINPHASQNAIGGAIDGADVAANLDASSTAQTLGYPGDRGPVNSPVYWPVYSPVYSPVHSPVPSPGRTLDESVIEACVGLVGEVFDGRAEPGGLMKSLSLATGLDRASWPLVAVRRMWDHVIKLKDGRRKTPAHEARWLNLAGFLLRPGFGHPLDSWRIKELWKIFSDGVGFHRDSQCAVEWWIMWRRTAGGLDDRQQNLIYKKISPALESRGKQFGSGDSGGGKKSVRTVSASEGVELWMLAASLELLSVDFKTALGRRLVKILEGSGNRAPKHYYWALSRLGARAPFHGPVDRVVSAAVAREWITALLNMKWPHPQDAAEAVTRMAGKTGDRKRDIDESLGLAVIERISEFDRSGRYARQISEIVPLEWEEEKSVFGESLPIGLFIESN
jgi:hypothetical protein